MAPAALLGPSIGGRRSLASRHVGCRREKPTPRLPFLGDVQSLTLQAKCWSASTSVQSRRSAEASIRSSANHIPHPAQNVHSAPTGNSLLSPLISSSGSCRRSRGSGPAHYACGARPPAPLPWKRAAQPVAPRLSGARVPLRLALSGAGRRDQEWAEAAAARPRSPGERGARPWAGTRRGLVWAVSGLRSPWGPGSDLWATAEFCENLIWLGQGKKCEDSLPLAPRDR